jgi:hypothetical protein
MLVHGVSHALVKQRERALDGGDMHREVGTVEDQDLAVEQGNPGCTRNSISKRSHF